MADRSYFISLAAVTMVRSKPENLVFNANRNLPGVSYICNLEVESSLQKNHTNKLGLSGAVKTFEKATEVVKILSKRQENELAERALLDSSFAAGVWQLTIPSALLLYGRFLRIVSRSCCC